MSEEVADIGHDEKVEKAFIESENHEFDGEKLQPYSIARRVAAQAIGLRYGALDSAHRARFNETNVYPGAFRDVAVVLYLCTLKEPAALDRAARDTIGAAKSALDWFESKGIVDTLSDKFLDAYLVFFKIMNEMEESRVELQKKTKAEPAKA